MGGATAAERESTICSKKSAGNSCSKTLDVCLQLTGLQRLTVSKGVNPNAAYMVALAFRNVTQMSWLQEWWNYREQLFGYEVERSLAQSQGYWAYQGFQGESNLHIAGNKIDSIPMDKAQVRLKSKSRLFGYTNWRQTAISKAWQLGNNQIVVLRSTLALRDEVA